SPDWGVKLTGKQGKHGGGIFLAKDAVTNLLMPGSQGSGLTSTSEGNIAAVLRYRYDVGSRSNIGLLFTNRSGGDYANRVGGIDVNYRATESDTISAQVLTSGTDYPDGVASDFELDPSQSGTAMFAQYRHGTRNWYWNARFEQVDEGFRADAGFMPRVGYRLALAGLERAFWPAKEKKTWWSRAFWGGDYDRTEELVSGEVLEEEVETWFGFGGPKQSYVSFDVGTRNRFFNGMHFDGEKFVNIYAEATPHKRVFVNVEFNAGDQIDFANTRPATRVRFAPYVRFRATRHLELQLGNQNERLYVDGGRLFTANVGEFRAVYQFNIRMFVRALLQYTDIERDPSLYTFTVDARTKRFFPQLLFSYKVNPQTVLFVGYASTRMGNETFDVTEADRTLFVKVGYAWAM
ncbi:MAG TPA: hypothetical protein VG106_03335, partial [Vicinamibacterales bacterium]|nr:hypothetical protein [Vicinamibacterales bacterium]